MLFIKNRDKVVGSGNIWQGNHFGEKLDRMHFIFVKKEYKGWGFVTL